MARPLRLEFPGAVYHLTARGNARNAIFIDDDDRDLFLACLSEVIARFGWRCHAYCLMDNHYHLLIETPEGNLSRGMRQLNGVYTQRVNRKHEQTGHVFQGRFKAIVVERDNYLLELCRYVVLNPVRASMAQAIEDYPWSSYPATLGQSPCPVWLSTDWLLRQFGKRRTVAQQRYADFVAASGRLASPWSALRGQVLLGSQAFAEKMRPLLENMNTRKEIPRAQRFLDRPTLKELLPDSGQTPKTQRDDAICKANLDYGYSLAAIARHVELHYSTVSKIIQK